ASAGPEPHIAERLAKLRASMAQAKIPALLVTNYQDVSYLTGFEGDDSYLVVTEDRALLISDSRYAEQIAREAPWIKTRIRTKGMLFETAQVLVRLKVHKIGVQDEALTLAQLSGLKEQLADVAGKKAREIKFVPVHEMVVALRHVKDETEIRLIEESIGIAEQALEALRELVIPGMTENEIASLLVHEMRKRGASGPSFDTIVAAGANGSLPHYRPGETKLPAKGSLLIDWGARYKGYCSDLTRVWFIGSIPPPLGEVYRVVLEAQQAAIAAIAPGKTGRQIDKIARDIITKAGYGAQFGHGLGHGFGRDIHEAIALSKLSKTTLQPGMVVTVEPGVYLPGVGGVRIEDDVLVTSNGCRMLSQLPRDLDWARR
ncbi:MAG: Xaa-Pro peptidase family protein, partial [Phycisphaerae bacterium]